LCWKKKNIIGPQLNESPCGNYQRPQNLIRKKEKIGKKGANGDMFHPIIEHLAWQVLQSSWSSSRILNIIRAVKAENFSLHLVGERRRGENQSAENAAFRGQTTKEESSNKGKGRNSGGQGSGEVSLSLLVNAEKS